MPNWTLSTLSLVCFSLAVPVSLAVQQTEAQTFQTFITVDVSGALGTVATDIDDAGDIVGFYVDSAGVHHGFVDVNGTINAVDVPGSTGTLIYGISPQFNNIVGWYTDSNGMQHGFMLSQGQFSTIDVPRATRTNALSIYDFVNIVGEFRDSKGYTASSTLLWPRALRLSISLVRGAPNSLASPGWDTRSEPIVTRRESSTG
jgi:hypothetical protein